MPIMKSIAMSHHFLSLAQSNSKLKKFHPNSPKHSNGLGFYKYRVQRVLLHSHSSSSSSSYCSHIVCVSSSSADFPGQLLEEEAKKMKMKESKRIAGIDQDELVDDPTLLADPDSCFCEFRGVKLHHKICDPELKEKDESLSGQVVPGQVRTKRVVGFPMILLHGFGASLFSWQRVMKALAAIVGSKVLAFDRPAFGLTSRLDLSERLSKGKLDASALNPYSMTFSVLATLHFIDLLGADKAIVVGHSAGAFVAVNSYFEAPERVAALILVAPAILAPLSSRGKVFEGNKSGGNNQIQEDSSSGKKSLWSPLVQLCSLLFKFFVFVLQAITQVVKGLVDIVNSLYKECLKAFLRSAFGIVLVRMFIDKFGIMAVKKSWYNSKLATEEVLAGYTKPLRTKGWDKALIEYTTALLTDTAPKSKALLSQRLHEISCPVLVVTGDTDRIVPAWNAERLSRAIPGSCFEVIKQCGHLPQEEKPDEFMSVVQNFMQRTFGDFAEQP